MATLRFVPTGHAVKGSPRPRRSVLFLALCLAATLLALPARAEDATTGAPDKQATTKKGTSGKLLRHPSIKFGPLEVDFTARLEHDARMATPAVGLDQTQFEWQDRRIGVKGTAFERIEFEMARELGEDFETSIGLREKTPWRDVYVNLRVARALEIEAGRFKLPFGREALTGESNIDFVYRSLAARVLSPSRDSGIMIHGRAFRRSVSYQLGYFTRDGDHARTNQTEGGRDALASRLVVTVLGRTASPAGVSLQIGAAAVESRLDDRLGIRGRTVFGDGMFFDRMFVNGRRLRLGLEAAWAYGPVSVSSEYITVADERKGMGFDGEDLPSVVAGARYIAGTWVVTGERKDGRAEPRHGLFQGGAGAIEVAARVEDLRFDSATYPGLSVGFPDASSLQSNADRVITLGLNWYLNHYFKIQGNLVRESIEDAQRSPAPAAGGRFTSFVVRFQFSM